MLSLKELSAQAVLLYHLPLTSLPLDCSYLVMKEVSRFLHDSITFFTKFPCGNILERRRDQQDAHLRDIRRYVIEKGQLLEEGFVDHWDSYSLVRIGDFIFGTGYLGFCGIGKYWDRRQRIVKMVLISDKFVEVGRITTIMGDDLNSIGITYGGTVPLEQTFRKVSDGIQWVNFQLGKSDKLVSLNCISAQPIPGNISVNIEDGKIWLR